MPVFISYRRADTQQAAGRLADRLGQRFGSGAVVIDVDTDQVGRDYRTLISEHLDVADVVLALIGPRFLAMGAGGIRRLDEPDDAIRMDLARALARNVPVIPVLVDGAELPHPDELPTEVRNLVFRGSVELAHHRFDRDYSFLEERVARFLAPATASPGPDTVSAGSDSVESPGKRPKDAERKGRSPNGEDVATSGMEAAAGVAESPEAATTPKEPEPVVAVRPLGAGEPPARFAAWFTLIRPGWIWTVVAVLVVGVVIAVSRPPGNGTDTTAAPGSTAATTTPPAPAGGDVTAGRAVYEANCTGCHQQDGSGVERVFPPLLGNQNATDADYVTNVVRNGLSGRIRALGITYDGYMPQFSMSDADLANVVAYVQSIAGVSD